MSPERASTLFAEQGEMFREMVQGLIEILAARAGVKSEFRLEQTTIQPRENNPLKFSRSVEEAITTLLEGGDKGYLPPVEAVREGFEDVKAHQLAVFAGMQVALTALLQRFQPDRLEERMAREGGFAAVFKGGKKSRYWDAFCELYQEIAREAEDDFHALFGREFAEAYEMEVRSRKAPPTGVEEPARRASGSKRGEG
jgi:type VI secretion system protein